MKLNKVSIMVSIMVSFGTFYSCKSNEVVIEDKITKCVNEVTNFSEYNKSGQGDFYTMIKEIEKVIFLQNKLQNFNKEDYIKKIVELLINKEKTGEKLYKETNKIFDKYGYIPSVNNFKVFNQCPFFVLVTEKNEMKSSLFFQSQLLNEIEANGYKDTELIKELITSTTDEDFKKIVYRAPVVLVLISCLDNIYGEVHSAPKNFDFSK